MFFVIFEYFSLFQLVMFYMFGFCRRHRSIPGFCVPETIAFLCDTNKMAARWFPWQWFLHHSHTVDPDLKWKSYSAERDTHTMLALLPQKDRYSKGHVLFDCITVQLA